MPYHTSILQKRFQILYFGFKQNQLQVAMGREAEQVSSNTLMRMSLYLFTIANKLILEIT